MTGLPDRAVRRVRRALASIRTRLVATVLVVLAVALAGTALGTRQVLLSRVDERIDDQLTQEAEELRLFADEGLDPTTGAPFGEDAGALLEVFVRRSVPTEGETIVAYVDGEPFVRTLQEVPYRIDLDDALASRWATTTTTDRGTVGTPAGPMEYLAVPLTADGAPAGVLLVGLFRDVVAAEVEQTIRVTAVVALVALLLALSTALGLAGTILRPLRRLTTAAGELSDTALSRRLDVVGHDEVAQLASSFNAMLERLETAFATQRRFVDDAGHELRTPLTIVRGHVELLGADPGPQERAATTALVLDELDRMGRIVEDLLTLARAEQPDFVVPAPFDLDELTTTVLRQADRLSDEHRWVLDRVGVGVVTADEQRLTQALLQLAHNATRHTPPGTTVRIGSALGPDELRLWVADDGPGVAPADRERVFERFRRGGGPRRSDGAGLGLAIVDAIATAHGGTARLVEPPDGGARFEVVLPVDGPPVDGTGPDDPADPAGRGERDRAARDEHEEARPWPTS